MHTPPPDSKDSTLATTPPPLTNEGDEEVRPCPPSYSSSKQAISLCKPGVSHPLQNTPNYPSTVFSGDEEGVSTEAPGDSTADAEDGIKQENAGEDNDKVEEENVVKKEGAAEAESEASYRKKIDAAQDLRKILLNSKLHEPREVEHLFWDTMPVVKNSEHVEITESGPIDQQRSTEDVRQTPFKLPAGFVWCECDIQNEEELDQVYELLAQHYVEDDEGIFRFKYSKAFLKYALLPPGYKTAWHLGVRIVSSNQLVGFITAIPATLIAHQREIKLTEVNFLCVHKKLREKRLAPVLIKEITRRINLDGIWQAVYTAGLLISKPIAKCRYWHRSLNPKKLVEIRFSSLSGRMTMKRAIRLYWVPDTPQLSGIREMTADDVPAVHELLTTYLQKYLLHPQFSQEECAHWFLKRESVVYSYVRETEGKVTDFFSFYELPSSVLDNGKYDTLKAAYLYYNVPQTCTPEQLIYDVIILAKSLSFDVLNALDILEHRQTFKNLKFSMGDGLLQYYLFNWKCPEIQSSDVGLVML